MIFERAGLEMGEVQSSYIHHDVVCGKVVEHVAGGLVAKSEEAGERHGETCEH